MICLENQDATHFLLRFRSCQTGNVLGAQFITKEQMKPKKSTGIGIIEDIAETYYLANNKSCINIQLTPISEDQPLGVII